MDVIFLRQAYKFIQNADDGLYLKLKKEIDCLVKDPYKSAPLKGNLRKIRSYHFIFRRAQFRIAYKVEKYVIIILIS